MSTETTLSAAEMAEAAGGGEEPTPAPQAAATAEPVGANVGTTNGTKVEEVEDESYDLTSIVPSRKKVRLPMPDSEKGEIFELRLLDDFGIVDQQELMRMSRRFDALWNSEETLGDKQQVELKWLLDHMFERVLDASDEAKAKVPDHIRSRVVTAFTVVPLIERQKFETEARDKEEKETSGDQSGSGS